MIWFLIIFLLFWKSLLRKEMQRKTMRGCWNHTELYNFRWLWIWIFSICDEPSPFIVPLRKTIWPFSRWTLTCPPECFYLVLQGSADWGNHDLVLFPGLQSMKRVLRDMLGDSLKLDLLILPECWYCVGINISSSRTPVNRQAVCRSIGGNVNVFDSARN